MIVSLFTQLYGSDADKSFLREFPYYQEDSMDMTVLTEGQRRTNNQDYAKLI